MAHIHPIILCITRCENNHVIHDFDAITNWDLTILCPRVIKRTDAGCVARERTKGLPFTNHCRWGNFLSYSGWNCVKRDVKKTKVKNHVIKRTTPKTIFTNLFEHLKVGTALTDYDSAVFIHYVHTTRKPL